MARYLRSSAAMLFGVLQMAAALQVPHPARACASAGSIGARVQVVDESAVIIWDAAAHQEHFIRRATFDATSEDFGFLVPTPSAPSLSETDDFAFSYLEHLIRPKVVDHKQIGFTLTSLLFLPAQTEGVARTAADSRSVQVLDTRNVAGYDAVVLSADSADALREWLRSHGYAARPALLAWLNPYVEAHWKITAFKISKDNPRSPHAASSAVAMSFTTSRPFFPYREPADQRDPGHHSSARSLRIFVLSSARMEGSLGASAFWPGKVVCANPVADTQRKVFERYFSLSAHQVPANMWLTAFEDRSSPRPGTDDLYFAPAAQQTAVVPPPVTVTRVERIGIPVEALALVAVLGGFFRTKRRRKTSQYNPGSGARLQ